MIDWLCLATSDPNQCSAVRIFPTSYLPYKCLLCGLGVRWICLVPCPRAKEGFHKQHMPMSAILTADGTQTDQQQACESFVSMGD
jgi:hypothetical protein